MVASDDKLLHKKARTTALQIEQLMAVVDFKYNRHQRCLVCREKYMHHADGLPCVSDSDYKEIIKHK